MEEGRFECDLDLDEVLLVLDLELFTAFFVDTVFLLDLEVVFVFLALSLAVVLGCPELSLAGATSLFEELLAAEFVEVDDALDGAFDDPVPEDDDGVTDPCEMLPSSCPVRRLAVTAFGVLADPRRPGDICSSS